MKNFPVIAALVALLGVALGAFGAHALAASLAARDMTEVWQTAVLYHLLHAVAAWSLSHRASLDTWSRRAGWMWLSGIALFSGSLYLLALDGPRWLGPITPLGGIAFILGWAFAALGARRSSTSPAG